MSNKYKKMPIKLVTPPKTKLLLSLKSPTSAKSIGLPMNSFKNAGLEAIINELLEVKKQKQKFLEIRRQ